METFFKINFNTVKELLEKLNGSKGAFDLNGVRPSKDLEYLAIWEVVVVYDLHRINLRDSLFYEDEKPMLMTQNGLLDANSLSFDVSVVIRKVKKLEHLSKTVAEIISRDGYKVIDKEINFDEDEDITIVIALEDHELEYTELVDYMLKLSARLTNLFGTKIDVYEKYE